MQKEYYEFSISVFIRPHRPERFERILKRRLQIRDFETDNMKIIASFITVHSGYDIEDAKLKLIEHIESETGTEVFHFRSIGRITQDVIDNLY